MDMPTSAAREAAPRSPSKPTPTDAAGVAHRHLSTRLHRSCLPFERTTDAGPIDLRIIPLRDVLGRIRHRDCLPQDRDERAAAIEAWRELYPFAPPPGTWREWCEAEVARRVAAGWNARLFVRGLGEHEECGVLMLGIVFGGQS